MENIFQNLVYKFGDKIDVGDLVNEVKSLSHTKNDVLKENICRLEEINSHLTNDSFHLQVSIDELCEEATPSQEDNNNLFHEYQALKEDYDSLLLKLTEEDETIQGLLVCRHNLELEVY